MSNITMETRRESYDLITEETAAARRKIILNILQHAPHGMTARELAAELYRRRITPSDERNLTAPRLTELKALGQVKVLKKKKCAYTGRNVAVWAVREADT